jgi:hypothetical protein
LVICDLVLSLCDVMLRYACRNARLVWGRSDARKVPSVCADLSGY